MADGLDEKNILRSSRDLAVRQIVLSQIQQTL